MVLFIDAISKISRGQTTYRNIDRYSLKKALGSNPVAKSKSKQISKTPVKNYNLSGGSITTEQFLTAYKAYWCNIITHEQMDKVKKEYYASRIKSC